MQIQERIVKRKDGWYLLSKDGKKKLGGPYGSKDGAVKRERQVQYFKHLKGSKMIDPMKKFKLVSEMLKED